MFRGLATIRNQFVRYEGAWLYQGSRKLLGSEDSSAASGEAEFEVLEFDLDDGSGLDAKGFAHSSWDDDAALVADLYFGD
jgi:hypothetical protein